MLPVHVFDTRLLPPADRFGLWLDVVESSAPALISSAHADRFDAHARAVGLGGLRLTDFTYPSLTMVRTPKLIRRADPEMYQLSLTRVGVGAVSQQRRESLVHAAEFTLLDNSRPFEVRHEAPPGQLLNAITVNIPHAALPLSPARVTKLLAGSISGSTGMGGLLAQFLRRIARHPEQFTAADAGRLSAVAIDLIAAMLAQRIDAEDTLPEDVRQHALRLRIESFIDRHLGDPELTPSIIAGAHHISLRTLHRVFEGGEATVAGLIRRRRLERCRRDLADPLLAGQAVRVIAGRWGFTGKAHFSRAFRAAYGHSPQAYRDQVGATSA
ncbi:MULTISPECIES: helix-turn-helix domain-containing protein [Micromonospora]|uniref:Helix-turn-helix domain-containing protein n=1 Tax=Micromonospora solifontis TaxID=2487138 RepID=A0ABX9WCQ8_9ACTN|nr:MULTISPECIES: helix-turn-helix domain-containing protein [Micromonospora]NES16641.1 helix-turn-helix domain-containing protein [Micromonospora sp. PPF5-17B]NES38175.1 helix-turn-helix domain-containing protein [Micromonospora solifontis]NES56803.1 helix-turn-helix domain-containing protein [Micromonospora sp. PPF5-6]RNL96965.1 helix-turn-helix domain-containing protein [Micromonospora solifontis]